VLRIARRRLTDLALTDPTETVVTQALSAVEAVMSPRQARLDNLPKQLAELDELADRIGIELVLMKGAAIREWYPPEHPRDIGDVDLWVRDIDAAYDLAAALEAGGHVLKLDEMPWVKRSRDNVLYGVFNLRDPGGERYSVDIHYGLYSVRHCGYFEPTIEDTPRGRRLSSADDLACALANAAGDAFIDLKTINDLVIARRHDDLDWLRLTRQIEVAGLAGFTANVLSRVAQFYPDEAAELTARLPVTLAGEPMPALTSPQQRNRLAVTVLHAWREGRARSSGTGWPLALKLAATATRYYSRPLRLRAVERRRYPRTNRMPSPAPHSCIRLVPAQAVVDEGGIPGLRPRSSSGAKVTSPSGASETFAGSRRLEIVRSPWGDVVRAVDGRVFLPTVYYKIDRQLLDAVTR
jgi:hypothetical protein